MNINKNTAVIGVLLGSLGMVIATPASAEAVSTKVRLNALSIAKNQMNDPYVWGAAGPNKFDCSGLVYYAYYKAGYKWSRTTAQGQYNRTQHISSKYRRPGDLVFIGSNSKNIYHTGIYVGWKWKGKPGGWMVNANTGSYRGKKVVVAPIKEYVYSGVKAYYGRVK